MKIVGWEARTDGDGKISYVNTQTNQVSRTHPLFGETPQPTNIRNENTAHLSRSRSSSFITEFVKVDNSIPSNQ